MDQQQLRAAFEAMLDAVLIADDERRYVAVNPAACHLLGLPEERILGRRIEEFSPPGTTSQVQQQWAEFMASGRQSGDFTMWRPEGEPRHVRYTATANIVPGRHLSILRDVTASKAREEAFRESQNREQLSREATEAALELHRGIEEQLALIVEASSALLSSLEPDDVLGRILGLSARFLAADAYAIWRRSSADGSWSIVCTRGLSDRYIEERGTSLQSTYEAPAEPMVVDDVLTVPMLATGREEIMREGIRSMLVIPMRIHGENTATLLFYFRTPHKFEAAEVRIASALANLSASAIAIVELYEEQKSRRLESVNAQRRSMFLAEASDLLSSSLDYQTTLTSVARLAVPHIADWCAVDIRESSGERRRLAVTHLDESKTQLAYELERKYPDLPTDPIPTVMRTGEARMVPTISDSMLRAGARDDEHYDLLRTLGLKSCMMVPIIARERILGTITFVTAESGRSYDEADLQLAKDLARRAAIAMDNAALYAKAQEGKNQAEQALESLRKINEDLQQFAYVASHDLQEPLRNITNFVQLLGRKYKSDSDAETANFIAYIVNGVQRMRTLISDLLDYSRVANIDQQEPFRETDINDVLNITVMNLHSAIQESGATVARGPLPKVLADFGQLAQLFQNLIGNAIKYRNKDVEAKIEVTAERVGAEWVFTVQDNGIGIDSKYAERVFGIFKRLHGAGQYSGTGVGLAICKKIVERHLGRIWVESEPGRGSAFRFTLPAGDKLVAGV